MRDGPLLPPTKVALHRSHLTEFETQPSMTVGWSFSRVFSRGTFELWTSVSASLLVLQAWRMASSVWQLMFLHGDEQVYSMSVSEAKKLGYSLTASDQRLVLRAQYKQPQAEIKMVS